VRRTVAGLLAFLALSGTFVLLPVYADAGPDVVPVETSAVEIDMGSVTAPAPAAEVQTGTSEPVTAVPATTPALTASASGTRFSLVGVTWAADPAVDDTVVQVRVKTRGGAWGEWNELPTEDADQVADVGPDARPRGGTAPLWTGPATAVEAELVTRSGAQPTDVRLDLVDPGTSDADAELRTPEIQDTADAALAMPDVFSRAQWGADERIRTWAPQYAPTIKAATLHHTANADYTADQVPALLRSIYRYHAVSLGWGDIGYNAIVDKFGRRWEGRSGGLASTVVGAHAGGFNTGTFGVSMLGDFDVAQPPQVMVDSVAALIAWKFSLYNVDPRGTTVLTSGGGGTARYAAGTQVTLPTIFGHRDVGSTACPGRYGYATLPGIRDRVAAALSASGTPIERRLATDSALRTRLGEAVGAEQAGPGYTWQEFRNGRLYASPQTGVHQIEGEILATYLALGGPAALGLPVTDESASASGRGRYNHVAIGGSIYWSPTTGARLVFGAIRDAWAATGWDTGPLGFPTSNELPAAGGGRHGAFEGGDVYWSPATGAHPVTGRIRDYWLADGGAGGPLGYPRSGERVDARGGGRYQVFTAGTAYWTLTEGTHAVRGAIRAYWESHGGLAGELGRPISEELAGPGRAFLYSQFAGGVVVYTGNSAAEVHGLIEDKYAAMGGVTSPVLGIPVTDELSAAGGRVRFNHFSRAGSIYWSPETGAHEVHGNVRLIWNRLGAERSAVGLPITDELSTSDGRGRYNAFSNGFVLWSERTGTHEVVGDIARRYAAMGREASALGYPVSGEYAVPGGRRSDFERGSITWSATTAATTVVVR
jgi:uncharacterized protein with LGFP repeats